MTNHSAEPSYIGYVYQPLHGLLLLLKSSDDEAFVKIEAEEDVVLHENDIDEYRQLKHTQKNISIKSDDFWRTLRIWLDFIIQDDAEGTPYFCLAIISSIVNNDPLSILRDQRFSRDDKVIQLLNTELEKEATRIRNAISDATTLGRKAPYQKRASACETFLSTDKTKRIQLLSKIYIIPACPNIVHIQTEIQNELKNVHPEIKERLAQRLMDWWCGLALKTITKQRNREIRKSELQIFVIKTAGELLQQRFIDDMSHLTLPEHLPMDLVNQKQHDIIGALLHTRHRSVCSEWFASEQRSKWVKDDPSCIDKINNFDENLIREWDCQFRDECEACKPLEDEYQKMGRSILDWTHKEAHSQVPSIREGWDNPNLVRGSYQVLAGKLEVGWHPHYKAKIGGDCDE